MDEGDIRKRPRSRTRVHKPPRRNLDEEIEVEFEERETDLGFPAEPKDQPDG